MFEYVFNSNSYHPVAANAIPDKERGINLDTPWLIAGGDTFKLVIFADNALNRYLVDVISPRGTTRISIGNPVDLSRYVAMMQPFIDTAIKMQQPAIVETVSTPETPPSPPEKPSTKKG